MMSQGLLGSHGKTGNLQNPGCALRRELKAAAGRADPGANRAGERQRPLRFYCAQISTVPLLPHTAHGPIEKL